MIENFATLEDIFADSSFDELVKEIPGLIDLIRYRKISKKLFNVEQAKNQPSRNMKERKLC